MPRMNLEHRREYAQRHYRDVERWRTLFRKYGITKEQYEAMLESQGGVCACCGHLPRGRNSLAVDHCHVTGRIRGLLCLYCNPRVERILAYIDRTSKTGAKEKAGFVRLSKEVMGA